MCFFCSIEDHVLDGLDVSVFDLDLGAEEEVDDAVEEDVHVGDECQEEARAHIKMKCVAYEEQILQLVKSVHGDVCKKCRSPLNYRSVQKGTAMLIMWESGHHHGGTWSSQPKYKGMFSGNLLLASSILMSGNSYQKIAVMAKFANLSFFSRTTFDNIQKLYNAPAINEHYGEKQDKLLASYDGRPVTLSGDGRSDSPGHSASFCTYSFCDEKTRQILHTTTVLVQEADGKSPNMERIGFERSLDYLRERVTVEGVVTDAHPQIASMFKNSKKYEAVKHHWDIWHGCKNLVKKVNAIAQQKKCEDLRGWIPRIANHFWHLR